MLRFREEEDAIRAQVNKFRISGDAMVQALAETWNDRLQHECSTLQRDLQAEKGVTQKARDLIIKHRTDELTMSLAGDNIKEHIKTRSEDLLARINELRGRK